jgi:hypothetical protein
LKLHWQPLLLAKVVGYMFILKEMQLDAHFTLLKVKTAPARVVLFTFLGELALKMVWQGLWNNRFYFHGFCHWRLCLCIIEMKTG